MPLVKPGHDKKFDMRRSNNQPPRPSRCRVLTPLAPDICALPRNIMCATAQYHVQGGGSCYGAALNFAGNVGEERA